MKKDVLIYDTTLRDGEQMSGVVFSRRQKIELAKKFYGFGVDVIGLMPAVSDSERYVAEKLVSDGLGDKLIAATMMKKEHINLAHSCGMKNIVLFTSLSDIHLKKKLNISRNQNLEKAVEYVDYSKGLGMNVFFAGEDSTRADFSYLVDFINSFGCMVDYFLPCDTLGVLTPFQTYDFIKNLKKDTDCKLGLHIHNDFGCATANTLAGIEAGAEMFSGTFTGIGERAGNARLEEVIVSLKYQYGIDLDFNYQKLHSLCKLVEKYSGVKVQKHKPIFGENAFSHESGLHVDGILKDSRNYEVFDPKEIGNKRNILFGKHSGLAGLKYLFGNKFSDIEFSDILLKIKKLAEKQSRSFSEEEILEIFA